MKANLSPLLPHVEPRLKIKIRKWKGAIQEEGGHREKGATGRKGPLGEEGHREKGAREGRDCAEWATCMCADVTTKPIIFYN